MKTFEDLQTSLKISLAQVTKTVALSFHIILIVDCG